MKKEKRISRLYRILKVNGAKSGTAKTAYFIYLFIIYYFFS